MARLGAEGHTGHTLKMLDATVLAINEEARALLAPTVAALGEALKTVPVAHADETGMRIAGKINWLHVLATTTLTWIGAHVNRGKKAFDAFGILTVFASTLIHDGWKQKISGGFRTQAGLDTFCTIRSYLATLHKQGTNLFHALTLTFQGSPHQPRFA